MSISRRGFLGTLSASLLSLQKAATSVGSVLTGLFLSGLRAIRAAANSYPYYIIDTDTGEIRIETIQQITMGGGNTIDVDSRNLRFLKLPTALLLALEPGKPHRPYELGDVLSLQGVDLHFENAKIVSREQGFVIAPSSINVALSLALDVNDWFPKDSNDLIGLDFDEDDELVIEIGPEITGISSPVKVSWPRFDLLLNEAAVIKNLVFDRQDDSLVVQFKTGQQLSGKRSLLVFEDPKAHVVINDGNQDFHPDHLAWTPRTGRLALSSKQQKVTIDPPKVQAVCDLDIVQTNTNLISFAAFEASEVPASDVSGAPPSVQLELSGFSSPASVSPLWGLLLPDIPLIIGPYSGSFQTRLRESGIPSDKILIDAGQMDSILFTAQRGKSTFWGTETTRSCEQRLKSLGARFASLGPGGLDDLIVKLEDKTRSVFNSDKTGTLTSGKGSILYGKYICISADQLLAPANFTCFSLDTTGPNLELSVANPTVNWVGAARPKSGLESAWTVLRKLAGDQLPGDAEYRPDELQVPNVSLKWSYQSGTSRIELAGGKSAALAAPPRLTSLGLNRFRSSVEPDDLLAGFTTCIVAPFSLREHPCEFTVNSSCQTNNPPTDPQAFTELNMWEPSSIVSIAPSPSVDGALNQIAKKGFSGGIEFRNAGLAMAGTVGDLVTASWVPDSGLPSLAPYKAILVKPSQGIQTTNSEDLISPCSGDCLLPTRTSNDGARKIFDQALGPAGIITPLVNAAISLPDVPIALSPIGGSISFDWSVQATPSVKSLKLHTYLARYQYNSASIADLLIPWGLEIEIIFRNYRDIDGNMKYVQKWRFVQDEQKYGTNNPVRIYNLRPLNATTWEWGSPFRFKADFDLVSGRSISTKKDVNLQAGSVQTSNNMNAKSTLPFDDMADATSPRNVFDDTLMRLHTITWMSSPDSGSTSGGVAMQVTAQGEVISAANLGLDSTAVSVAVAGKVDNTFQWSPTQNVGDPQYGATRATVGPGILRILPSGSNGVEPTSGPSIFAANPKVKSTQTETSSDITAKYEIDRDLDLTDVSFIQLLFPDKPQKIKGKLTLQFTFQYHKQNGQVTLDSQQTVTTCKFPDLSSVNKDVCDQDFGTLPIGIHPKTLDAEFTEIDKSGTISSNYSANMVADVGAPGFIVFRDSKFTLQDGNTTFNLGKFDLCPNSIIEIALQEILGNLSLFGGDNLSLHVGWDLQGPEIGLSINLLPANMGGGFITNLKFEIRFGLHIDTSAGGSGCAFALFFNLGEYSHPDLSFLDWANPGLSISDLALSILPQLRPVTLTIDPFVIRFTFILGIRKVNVSGPPEFGICVTGDAGLGVAFDIGVANGGASITLGARFCPDPKTGLIISVGVSIDAWATVLSIIDIRLHAELFINLYLSCAPSVHMIGHLVFSGYASLKIAFVTISASFTVNLDQFLGLSPCDKAEARLQGIAPSDIEIARHVDSCVREFAEWQGVAA